MICCNKNNNINYNRWEDHDIPGKNHKKVRETTKIVTKITGNLGPRQPLLPTYRNMGEIGMIECGFMSKP